MKKVLILSAAILATSVLHAGATTSAPTVLQAGVIRIVGGHQCGSVANTITQPVTVWPPAIQATVEGGDTNIWATGAMFRHNGGTKHGQQTIRACLNTATHPKVVWVFITVAGVVSA